MTKHKLEGVYDKLLIIHQMMHQNLYEQAKDYDYNTSEFMILMDLIAHPETDLTGLYSRVGMKKSAVSKIVQKLVEKGDIIRNQPSTDKRKVSLSLNDTLKTTLCRTSALNNTFGGYETLPCDLDKIELALNDVIEMLSQTR